MDQVLANLCVNARDAIAGIGPVAIDTQNTALVVDLLLTDVVLPEMNDRDLAARVLAAAVRRSLVSGGAAAR
jgi:hypothetical protein